jgi:ATP-dependent helicase/nuclease subunit A
MLQRLLAILPLQPDMATLAALENEFLTGAGAKVPFSAKVGAVPSKAARPALGALADQIDKLMLRVEAARADRLALALARKTEALHRFARAFLRRYQAAKDRRGWVDFDDLVVLATGLLSDPSLSAWVLYRLDGGIEHVLVDEAQDTSPAQWRLIQLLTAEFTAGEGRHDRAAHAVRGGRQEAVDLLVSGRRRDRLRRRARPFRPSSQRRIKPCTCAPAALLPLFAARSCGWWT